MDGSRSKSAAESFISKPMGHISLMLWTLRCHDNFSAGCASPIMVGDSDRSVNQNGKTHVSDELRACLI